MALEKTSAKPKLIETSDINKISKSPGQEIIADDGRFYYDSTLNTRHNLTGSKYHTASESVLYPGDTVRTGYSTGKSITLVTSTLSSVFMSATTSGTSYELTRSTNFYHVNSVYELGNRYGNFIDTIAKLASVDVELVNSDNKRVTATVEKINKSGSIVEYYNDGAIANVASVKLSWSGADFAPNKISYAIISGYVVSQGTGIGPQESDVYWDGYSLNFQPRRDANEDYTFPNDVYSRDKKLIGISDLVYNFDSTISTLDELRNADDLTYGLITLSETGSDYYYQYYSDMIPWDNKFTITTTQTGVDSRGNATYSQELVLPVSVDDIDISRPLEIYSSATAAAKKATISKADYYLGYGHIFFVSDYNGTAINPDSNKIPDSTKYIKIPLKYRPTSYSGHVSFINSSNELQLPGKLLIGKRTSRFGYPIFEEIVEPEAIEVISEDSTKPVQSKAVAKYIKDNLSTVYRVKGSTNSLPKTPQVGDVYNIINSMLSPLYLYPYSMTGATQSSSDAVSNIKKIKISGKSGQLLSADGSNILDTEYLPRNFNINLTYGSGYFAIITVRGSSVTIDAQGNTDGTFGVSSISMAYYYFTEEDDGFLKSGDNVVWTGTYWDRLSSYVDLSEYAKLSDLSTVYKFCGTRTSSVMKYPLSIGNVYNFNVSFGPGLPIMQVNLTPVNDNMTLSSVDLEIESIASGASSSIKILTLSEMSSKTLLSRVGLTVDSFMNDSPVNMPMLIIYGYPASATTTTPPSSLNVCNLISKSWDNNKAMFTVDFGSTIPSSSTILRLAAFRYNAIKEGVANNWINRGDNLVWAGWEFDDLAGVVDTSNFVTKDEMSGEIGSIVTDQTYKPTSSNAQSGKAVKEAVDAAVSSVYKMKGTSNSYPLEQMAQIKSASIGDTYNLIENGDIISGDEKYTDSDCLYANILSNGSNYYMLYYNHDKGTINSGTDDGTFTSDNDIIVLKIPGNSSSSEKYLKLIQTAGYVSVLTSDIKEKYNLTTITPSDYTTFAEALAAMDSAVGDSTTASDKYWQVVGVEYHTFARSGDNVVWNGKKWDVLSSYIDLSGYQKSLTYVNNLNTADLSDPNAIVNAANTKSYVDGKISDAITSNGTIVNISGTGQATKFGSLSVTESTASKADFGTVTLPGVAYHLLAYTDKAATVTVTCETGSFSYTASAGKIADIEILEDGVARVTSNLAHTTVTYTGTGGITSISFANSATSAVTSFKADVYGWKVIEADGASNEISALLKAIYDEQEYYKSLGTVNNVQYATPRYENKSDLPSIDTVGNLATVYGDQDLNNRGCYIFLNGVWFKLATETSSIMNNDTVEVTVE